MRSEERMLMWLREVRSCPELPEVCTHEQCVKEGRPTYHTQQEDCLCTCGEMGLDHELGPLVRVTGGRDGWARLEGAPGTNLASQLGQFSKASFRLK